MKTKLTLLILSISLQSCATDGISFSYQTEIKKTPITLKRTNLMRTQDSNLESDHADYVAGAPRLVRCVVAGGRDYQFTNDDKAQLDALPIGGLVSGGASGADRCGEQWATAKGIPIKRFPADWNAHGRMARPIRNRQMAEYAGAVALFPGGRGTDSMRREAERAGITVYDFTTNNRIF